MPRPSDLLPRKTLAEFPVPPVPKFDPACPETPTLAYDWHGVRFHYPEGWIVGENDDNAKEGRHVINIMSKDLGGLEQVFKGVSLFEERKSKDIEQAVDALWNLPPDETLDPASVGRMSADAVPETIQRLEMGGERALAYLRREKSFMPKMNDQWEIFLKRDGPDYAITSPHMFHPYFMDDLEVIFSPRHQEENDALACAYWTVVKSLVFPAPAQTP